MALGRGVLTLSRRLGSSQPIDYDQYILTGIIEIQLSRYDHVTTVGVRNCKEYVSESSHF